MRLSMLWALGASFTTSFNGRTLTFDKGINYIEGVKNYIIQVDTPVRREVRDALVALGVVLYDYLPGGGYLAEVPPRAGLAISEDPEAYGVLSLNPYLPEHKLHSRLFSQGNRLDDLYRITVTLFPGASAAEMAAKLVGMCFQVESQDEEPEPRVQILATPDQEPLLREVAEMSQVKWIVPRPVYRTWNINTRWSIQSHTQGDSAIWKRGIHGEDQIVGELDSGLDYYSCFFRDTSVSVPGPTHRKVLAYRNYGGDDRAGCGYDHGTHVGGTVAGNASYLGYTHNYDGMAYMAKITFGDIQPTSPIYCSWGALSINTSIYNIFQDFYNDGARVMTNSWGSNTNAYTQECRDLDQFMWDYQDALVLFAAGNASDVGQDDDGTIAEPATAKSCVAVGATSTFGYPDDEQRAYYSSQGPTYDGRLKPDVMAPGGDDRRDASNGWIWSTCNCNCKDPPQWGYEGCHIVGSEGTSMATPAVAGASLLVRQYFTEGWWPTGSPNPPDQFAPSGALMKSILVASTDKLANDDLPPDNSVGWGRVHLDNALWFNDADENGPRLWLDDHSAGLSTGDSVVYDIHVSSNTFPVKIVLAWSDYPAAVDANPAIVNDLDLYAVDPSGTYYAGNDFLNGWSRQRNSYPTSWDRLNTVEVIWVDPGDVLAGNWRVVVKAYSIPQPGQPYAITVLGDGVAPTPLGVGEGLTRPGQPVLWAPSVFRDRLEVRLNLAASGEVRLSLYDASGRRVRLLSHGQMEAGAHTIEVRTQNLRPGVYILRLSGVAEASLRVLRLP